MKNSLAKGMESFYEEDIIKKYHEQLYYLVSLYKSKNLQILKNDDDVLGYLYSNLSLEKKDNLKNDVLMKKFNIVLKIVADYVNQDVSYRLSPDENIFISESVKNGYIINIHYQMLNMNEKFRDVFDEVVYITMQALICDYVYNNICRFGVNKKFVTLFNKMSFDARREVMSNINELYSKLQ